SDSTQVPVDSRFISKHLFIPVIEPSNPQEVKDFVDLSFKISRRSELFAGYLITTNLADGGGTVFCRPNQYPNMNVLNKLDLATSRIDLNKRVLLPPKTWWQEESLGRRFQTAIDTARELGINRIEHPAPQGTRSQIGFVAAGLGHDYLIQALYEMGMEGEFPILKLGMSYPVDPQFIEELAAQSHRIVVVEERRGFMEEQIAEIVLKARQQASVHPDGRKNPMSNVEVWGKTFPDGRAGIPETRGLHPSILIVLLARLLKSCGTSPALGGKTERIEHEVERINSTERVDVAKLPPRLASFCPGCPHRDSASLCLQIKRRFMDPHYMKARHGRRPVDLLFHGDTGCYTMLMFPPNTDLMHDYSGMGLGGGTGVGTDPFVTNKEVVFMGDST
ncbi:MAG: indolepyruvate ferredoxin oxidoreductase, partial [Candidatus Hydrogenedentes bacterium]|nr:indolepyruvate ferredoxin oxidoreductase [Candidatus Hydrogenedentota bacterium]